ncbi:MAG TPA: DUF4167 domain-containing protein [Alphaproteobacteria bacterium]|jgi:hypothetical protein|nr:DUF4167 domain-containing protein [Alphaproteobacteria bacterium]HAM46888.1 DUF4167 domain-containing protein [Alphaproteobacteria bacterium]HBA42167.1 DUF4167 domain-containing protein [Alphaproteobacteria bacterium]HBC54279.1 DUF4167 domain-containing protein [Alphaproteobacteria bacterium]HBF97026.1 DUF4167 domain-containing protein [Alphaproteobacteria bacterium]
MRTSQNSKRARGRGRKPHGNNPNRTFDSNGPDVRIRGNASHICDKYQSLARDANASGDHVAAENYLQHAEHYYRLMAAAQAQSQSKENAPDPEAPKEREGRRQNGGGRRNGRAAATDDSDATAAPGTADASDQEKSDNDSAAVSAAPASDDASSLMTADADEQPVQAAVIAE